MLTHSNVFCWGNNLSIMIVRSMRYSFYHISKLLMVVWLSSVKNTWALVSCEKSLYRCHFIASLGDDMLNLYQEMQEYNDSPKHLCHCNVEKWLKTHNNYVYVIISQHCDGTDNWKILPQKRQGTVDLTWSPGDTKSQVISSHGIDLALLLYFSFHSRKVILVV